MRERALWIDIVRVAAIFAIVLLHVSDSWLSPRQALPVSMLTNAAVFFMASGALVLPLHESPRVFVRRHVLRVLRPLITWSAIYLLVMIAVDGLPFKQGLATGVQALAIPVFIEGWFCYVLIGLYLFVPIISPWIAQASKRQIEYFLLFWCLSGLLPLLLPWIYIDSAYTTFVGPFCGFVGYMVLGYYLARWKIGERGKSERAAFWAAVLLIGIVMAALYARSGLKHGFLRQMYNELSLNQMCVAAGLFALCSYIRRVPAAVSRIVGWFVPLCFGIYLSQGLIMRYVVPHIATGFWSALLVTLTLSIAISWLLSSLPTPIRRWFL